MKKSTMILIALCAVFVTAGLRADGFAIQLAFSVAAFGCAVGSLLTTLIKRK